MFGVLTDPGAVCAPGNVVNIFGSSTITIDEFPACLACLFDGVAPRPGTIWRTADDLQPLGIERGVIINPNGTLIGGPPPGTPSPVLLVCESGNDTFNITLECK